MSTPRDRLPELITVRPDDALLRLNAIKQLLEDVTQKTLTGYLRRLERNWLVCLRVIRPRQSRSNTKSRRSGARGKRRLEGATAGRWVTGTRSYRRGKRSTGA